VIVPAYLEGDRIVGSIIELERELKKLGRPYEIVLVVDGCADTYRAAKTIRSDTVMVYYYEENIGKGYALKYGVNRATGDLVTFIDADMSIDPNQIDVFIKLIDVYNADIVVGSKRHPQSKVHYPLFRRFQSFCYQLLITVLFQINVKDTQTGLKLFRRQVIQDILPRALVKAYAFDLELLVIAHHLGYRKIIEAPIEIKQQFTSTVKLSSAFWTFLDTCAIFYRLHFVKYYDQPHFDMKPDHHGDGEDK
jgi:glycosyltransferase involved in cell wall biosynthesis